MDVDKPAETLKELLAQLNRDGTEGFQRYMAVKQFINFKARNKGVPVNGSFELTPLCNLDCKMCYVHLNREQMKGAEPLSVDTWKNLMQQAVDSGLMYASLTGGECLTYPGFKELYLFLQSKGIEINVLSNGILMNDGMIDFFKAHPPALIQITLYGASEEAYEKVTGHRRFETVSSNIRKLKEAGIPVSVAVTPNEYMEDAEEVVRFIIENKYPYIINSGLNEPREETGRTIHDASLDVYVRIYRYLRESSGKETEAITPDEELPDIGGHEEKRYGVQCGAGRSGFSISWNGLMRPCNNFPTVGEPVLEIGFTEAWKRTNRTAVNFPVPEECNGCKYYSICKHCVCEHAAGAPIGHASQAVCAFARRFVSEGLNILS